MEALAGLACLLVCFLVVGGILAIVALGKASRSAEAIERLNRRVEALEEGLRELEGGVEPRPPVEAPAARTGPPPPARPAAPARPAEARRPPPPPRPRVQPVPRPPEPVVWEPYPSAEVPTPPKPAVEAAAPEPVREPAAPPPPVPKAAPARGKTLAELVSGLGEDWWTRLEEAIGKRWMLYAGGLAVFAAAGFFIKYAYDQKWITPAMIVGAGLAVGIAFVVAGDQFVRRRMRLFGLALIGAPGLPILYVSLFASFQVYRLVPQWAAFAAMVVVTAAGMTLAVRHDALVLSFLAVLGGLLTPVLVSTGEDARDALFGYLLILDVGVLGTAFVRKWRALDVLAFTGTAALFAGWFATFYSQAALVPTLLWLGAFYLTFLLMPFVYHLREGTPATLERFLMALVVATGVFAYAFWMLHPAHRLVLGYIALGMGVCYVTLGTLARQRVPTDVRGVFAFIALAMIFATIAVPLELGLNGITLVWAAEAVALVYLGYRFAYWPVRAGGLVVLAITVARLFVRHWPLHAEPFPLVFNEPFGVATFVCLAGGAFAAVHHGWSEEATQADRLIKIGTAIAAGLLGLVMCHAEFGTWFALRAKQYGATEAYLSRSAGAVVWAVGSLAFLAAGVRARCLAARGTGVLSLLLAALLIESLYVLGLDGVQRHFANARFLVALAVVATAFGHAWGLRRCREWAEEGEWPLATALGLGAGFALLAALHVELAEWLSRWGAYPVRWSVSALWAVGSLGFLGAGLRARSVASRVSGLVALGIAVALGAWMHGAELPAGYRHFVSARFGVGVLVAATLLAHGLLLRGCRAICSEREGDVGEALYLAAGVGLLLVLHVEVHGWLGQWGRYAARCGVSVVWLLGTAGFLAAGLRWPSLARRTSGAGCLAVAACLAASLYEGGLLRDYWHFVNARFAIALVTALAALAHGFALRRFRGVCQEEEAEAGEVFYLLGGVAMLLAVSYELDGWLGPRDGYRARCGVAALWTLGAGVFLAAGIRWKSLPRRAMGLPVLAVALGLCVRLFEGGLLAAFALCLNVRFLVCLLAAGMVFGFGHALRRFAERLSERERALAKVLPWVGVVLLFLLLSAEGYLYARSRAGADAERARWSSMMALSIAWSVYAVGLLAVGFWRRVRALRLTALGLFGLAAVKLVVVDLTLLGIQQIYRILSFLAVGLLMIGASYLYHRIEKRLREEWGEE